MIVKHGEENVLGSEGLGETKSFSIRTTAHAFRMLSSGLYSDKIGAVLREIGCNAHDAHISGGIARTPFEVKLPNAIDNEFWIKDFGPGLSYDEVMNLYTTYFASTKQTSNDFTGGFGLGSKSPFSYVDSFTITACHGGKERMFSAYLGNDGAPTISMLTEHDTTETGIKISFPVPAKDFAEFASKAQAKYTYFDPLPTILGGSKIKSPSFSINTPDYAIFEGGAGQGGWLTVQMGNVAYLVNIQKLDPSYYTDPILAAFTKRANILLRMDMGSCSVAASREALQFDKDTVTNIKDKLLVIAKDTLKDLEAKYDAAKSWNERIQYRAHAQKVHFGMALSVDLLTKALSITPDKAKAIYAVQQAYSFTANMIEPAGLIVQCVSIRGNRSNKTRLSSYGTLALPLIEDIVLIAGNANCGAQRIKLWLNDADVKAYISVYPAPGAVVKQSEIDSVVAQILALTGAMPVIDLNKLAKPTIIRSTVKKTKAFKDIYVYDWAIRENINTADIKPEGKVYVRTVPADGTIYYDTRRLTHYNLTQIVEAMQQLDEFIPFVAPKAVMYTKIKASNMDKSPDWTPYDVYLNKVFGNAQLKAAIMKELSGFVPRIDVFDPDYATKPASILMYMRHKRPELFDLVKPGLRKAGMLKEFEILYKETQSTKPVREPSELMTAYKVMARFLNLDASGITYDVTKSNIDINERLSSRLAHISMSSILELEKVSPTAANALLKDLIV